MTIHKQKLEGFLSSVSKDELVQQLIDLIERFDNVEEYYKTKLQFSTSKILDKYKIRITNALFPDGEWQGGFDLQAVEKIIKRYENIESPVASVINLKLFAIKSASDLADAYGGDYGEDFYIFFEEMYEGILQSLKENGQLFNYQHLLKSVAEQAFEGYGHNDTLIDFYEQYFSEL